MSVSYCVYTTYTEQYAKFSSTVSEGARSDVNIQYENLYAVPALCGGISSVHCGLGCTVALQYILARLYSQTINMANSDARPIVQ